MHHHSKKVAGRNEIVLNLLMQLVSGQVTLKTYNLLIKSHVVLTQACRESPRYSRFNAYCEIPCPTKRSIYKATQTRVTWITWTMPCYRLIRQWLIKEQHVDESANERHIKCNIKKLFHDKIINNNNSMRLH